ncbi:MAG: DUF4838 domain-containing protein, partial [Planctomycetes bacterium]|nr:DUF4838 domain-containing protein [Planctomycetota bacterium]
MPERLLVVPVAFALASSLLAMASAESTSDWVVGWVGSPRAKDAASVFAKYASMVLDAPVAVADKPTKAKHVFLVTDAKNGPKDVAAKLDGKRLDAFTIQYPVKLDGQDVCLLLAHDEQGYDYPVYHFLTKFMGVHWVGPGELGVVWTKRPGWAMPAKIDLVMNPDFEMRLWSGDSFSSREWLARSGRMGFHHALGHVFHPDKHGGTPEVYPLVGGKRYVPAVKTGPRALSGWQPCTASPKSAEIATQHVLETLTKSPQMLSVSLSVNDGAGNTCECELCRAQDAKDAFQPGKRPNLSDRFYRFYNAVMGRVLEKAPNAYIAVLGYGPCKVPPTEVKVHSRIQVFEVQPSAEALKAWKAAGATPNMYLWLWDGGFLTVRPDLHTLADVIRTSRDLGGLGLYSEIKAHWVVSTPKFYVLAHLLWDTRQDPDKLLNDYLRLAYGESAAPHVRAFFDKWYEIYRRRPKEELFKTSWGWRDPVQLQDIRRDDLAALDAALRLEPPAGSKPAGGWPKATLTPEQKQRLAYLATYYQLMRINAEQYLVGREMSDRKWVSAQPPEAVLKAAEGSLTLTADFDQVWREQVATDKTGWLMDGRAQKNPDAYWDDFLAQLRTMVSSAHET